MNNLAGNDFYEHSIWLSIRDILSKIRRHFANHRPNNVCIRHNFTVSQLFELKFFLVTLLVYKMEPLAQKTVDLHCCSTAYSAPK